MRIGLIGAGRIGALHARTLAGLAAAGEVLITDADQARAAEVAKLTGASVTDDPFSANLDALVIASPTPTHPELIQAAVARHIPVFCEKPVAPDIQGTRAVIEATRQATVQIGFQRRFDDAYRAARAAVRSGELGWVHTIRSVTLDPAPPPAGYIPSSGGIFRDCAVHDFDSIRWVSGREVTRVYAVGANRGAEFFKAAGDVDTASAVLTLDDETLALVSCTRYNAAGYDVRLEVLGSRDSVVAGLDDKTPLRGQPGDAYRQFLDRFAAAYRAELETFLQVAAGNQPSPCTPRDALEAFYIAEACELSRQRDAPVTIEEVRK